MVQDIDKTVVNVDAMIGSAGSNTLELLGKTPGVTVTIEGEISLNGKTGVLVLIDGRATYLPGPDLAAYLKSLPGGLLDKIELMDNPPAKYDASGSAIINIRLKKNKLRGFTGNISSGYSQGRLARYNEVANLNLNYKKITLFGNVGYYKEDNYANDTYYRRFYNADGGLESLVSLANKQRYRSGSTDLRMGMDHAISSNTSYGLVVNINRNTRHDQFTYTSKSYDAANQPDSTGVGNTAADNRRTNLGLNLNFLHKLNDKGRELSADINYLNYRSQGNQALYNFLYLPGNNSPERDEFLYRLPSDIGIFAMKVDYVHPLKNKASVEAGIKSGMVRNDNDSRYFTVNGNINLPDYSKSNHFIYHENIYAAYINARKSWKRFGGQLGLRIESTRLTGNQLGNTVTSGTSFNRNYTDFFPTLFLSYKLDSAGDNTFTTSIARRINRPNYQQLNPFLFFRDNYSYSSGYPLLNPQYQYRLDFKYQHKQYFGIELQYMRAKDIIFQTTAATDNIFITRPGNVSSGCMVILATNFTLNPAEWWAINTNLLLVHMELNGSAYNQVLNPATNTSRLTVMNQFHFNKGWSAELSGYYSGKDIQGQTIRKPRYRLFAAGQKKIWKDKGSIRVTMEDLFHLLIQKDNSVSIKQAESFHTNTGDTQRLGVAFTWRFGKDNSDRKRKHTDNAADPEKGRVE